MEEITQENKENLHQCKDDSDDWCTVKIKSKSKRRARFKKKMESALEPIIENVSEDELYFSSSSEEEVQQQKTIELVLRPQKLNNSNNRNEENNNKLKRALGDVFSSRNDRNNKEFVRSPPEPHQCSIIDKLHQTLDKVSSRYSSASLSTAAGVMFHDNSVLRCISCSGLRYILSEICFISGIDTKRAPMEQGRLPRPRLLRV